MKKKNKREAKAMDNLREGMMDLLISGKVLLKTPWFCIWYVKK